LRDKYTNKTPVMRFLHKYTGGIGFSIIVVVIAISWYYYDDSIVFFENWPCYAIYDMKTEGMTDKEHIRHQEIVKECDDRPEKFKEPQVP